MSKRNLPEFTLAWTLGGKVSEQSGVPCQSGREFTGSQEGEGGRREEGGAGNWPNRRAGDGSLGKFL